MNLKKSLNEKHKSIKLKPGKLYEIRYLFNERMPLTPTRTYVIGLFIETKTITYLDKSKLTIHSFLIDKSIYKFPNALHLFKLI